MRFQIKISEEENNDLREQLSTALEHQTTKSVGSFGSDDFRPNDHHHAKVNTRSTTDRNNVILYF